MATRSWGGGIATSSVPTFGTIPRLSVPHNLLPSPSSHHHGPGDYSRASNNDGPSFINSGWTRDSLGLPPRASSTQENTDPSRPPNSFSYVEDRDRASHRARSRTPDSSSRGVAPPPPPEKRKSVPPFAFDPSIESVSGTSAFGESVSRLGGSADLQYNPSRFDGLVDHNAGSAVDAIASGGLLGPHERSFSFYPDSKSTT